MFGGTRGVTWSIDRIIHRHACITWGVELILAIFFHNFLVCLTDITTTIKCSLFSMFDFIRYVKSVLVYMLVVLVVYLEVLIELYIAMLV